MIIYTRFKPVASGSNVFMAVYWKAGPEVKTEDPVALDDHRGMAAQKATVLRREKMHTFLADQKALKERQEELEALLLATSARSWPEVAAKAQYLIQLFAATPEALDPRRKKLIGETLEDIRRLCEATTDHP